MTFKFQGKDDPERKAFYEYTKAHTVGKSPQHPLKAAKRGSGIAAGCFLVILVILACIGMVNALVGGDRDPTRAVQVPNTYPSSSLSEPSPSTTAPRSPSHTRTTVSPLNSPSPPGPSRPAPSPPKPAMPSTSISDPRGDVDVGPAGGAAPGYVDLIGVSVQTSGPGSAAVIITTAGKIPDTVPLYDEGNEINYGAFFEQNGQELFLSISSRVETSGRWKVVAINMFGAFKADRAHLDTSPAIQGTRLMVEIPVVLRAGGATIDLKEPIALSAESGAVIYPGGWADQA